jgi:hypothetical protein
LGLLRRSPWAAWQLRGSLPCSILSHPLALSFYDQHGFDLTKVVVGHAGDSNDLEASQPLLRQAVPNWNFLHISHDVLPALRNEGVTDEQISTMLVDNPRRYFTPVDDLALADLAAIFHYAADQGPRPQPGQPPTQPAADVGATPPADSC